jgi:hypothetical protein
VVFFGERGGDFDLVDLVVEDVDSLDSLVLRVSRIRRGFQATFFWEGPHTGKGGQISGDGKLCPLCLWGVVCGGVMYL